LYLACGRNLAVPAIAHAFSDTLDFLLIYFGEVSGNALELLQVGRVSGIGIISFTATFSGVGSLECP
jgi:hypothetical protein